MRGFICLICSVLMVGGLLVAAGCAGVPIARPAYIAGAVVETLVAEVTVTVHSPDGNIGGNGYLIYRRPDRFHLVMLTPFGTSALEFFAAGDRITLLIPSKGVAYLGTFDDLPERQGLQGWRMMRWVVDGDPLFSPGVTGRVERVGPGGRTGTATYGPDGLLEQKISPDGEQVLYRDYRSVEGVPFPAQVEFSDPRGTRVTIVFEGPEINRPVEDAALTPNLEGVTILPLASLKGV